jgi:hypothetical protein
MQDSRTVGRPRMLPPGTLAALLLLLLVAILARWQSRRTAHRGD